MARPDAELMADAPARNKVELGGDRRRGWHSAYRRGDGELVVEWLEYEDPAPYDHATQLVFDVEQEAALRAALDLKGEGDDLITALASRFRTYWAVRTFADGEGLSYQHHVDFSP